MGILTEGLFYGPDGPWAWIDDLRGPILPGGYETRTIFHFSMRQSGTVLDHKDPFIPDTLGAFHQDGRFRQKDFCFRVVRLDVFFHLLTVGGGGVVHLVDEGNVRMSMLVSPG